MAAATWNGAVTAERGETVMVEGNHYFPPGSVRTDNLRPTTTTHDVPAEEGRELLRRGGGRRSDVNAGAAWYSPDPKEAASEIRGHVAFRRGVTVEA